MKFLKFIRWWWNNMNPSERGVLSIFSILVSFFAAGFVFGLKGVLFYILGIFIIMAVFLLIAISKVVMKKWGQFNREIELEQQRIVDRLKGS